MDDFGLNLYPLESFLVDPQRAYDARQHFGMIVRRLIAGARVADNS